MEPKDFKHKLQIQIRYKDVDIQGHVNNANHITYFETARVNYFNESFEISNLITKKVGKEEMVCAHGKSVIVCFNYDIKQTVEIPAAWKEAVAGYEK
jgi:acyl-CoA thioesterase FadM